jgi:RNA polymerase nonessential primary-like sigma factor
MEQVHDAYDRWSLEPTPDNMSKIVDSLSPTINSEIQRYTGPKPLLRTRAKSLAIKAVRTYKPDSGARLNSWVVTQLQPLSRYGRESGRLIHTSELAVRQGAAMAAAREELMDELDDEPTDQQLADHVGISTSRVKTLRALNRPVLSEGAFAGTESPEAVEPAVVETGPDPILHTATEMVYAGLSPRDKMIIDLKTGRNGKEQLDNQSIARRLGVTPALISQRSAMIAQQILETRNRV